MSKVTVLRDSIEVEKQKLLTEQLRLTAEIQTLQERIDNVESLNRSHEAKISEQQNRIDELLAEGKQVSNCLIHSALYLFSY